MLDVFDVINVANASELWKVGDLPEFVAFLVQGDANLSIKHPGRSVEVVSRFTRGVPQNPVYYIWAQARAYVQRRKWTLLKAFRRRGKTVCSWLKRWSFLDSTNIASSKPSDRLPFPITAWGHSKTHSPCQAVVF